MMLVLLGILIGFVATELVHTVFEAEPDPDDDPIAREFDDHG